MNAMEKAVYIGIDPGAKGSMATIHPDGISLVPWDETIMYIVNLREIVDNSQGMRIVAAVEHVGAMPGQGVVSMFNFGKNFGTILGILHALKIPFELVRPQRWMKYFGITGDKNNHIAVAHRLFPEVSLKRTKRCSKDDDGHADALLLAEWARRNMA